MKIMGRAVSRTLVLSVAVAAVVGVIVLLVTGLRGAVYEGRVGLIAEPSAETPGTTATAQYGEVVSLALPALVELARSPSVLRAAATRTGFTPGEVGKSVSVELVPASGLARLSVRAPSAEVAGTLSTSIGKAMIDADLLAPVGRLRLLDEQADVTRIAPDWLLATGLAVAAAAAAGIATAAVRRLRKPAESQGVRVVREALTAAGTHRTVVVVNGDDPALLDRLAVLGDAAGRPIRVVAVSSGLSDRAAELTEQLGTGDSASSGASAAVIALAPADRPRQDELTAAVGVLPDTARLVAVVLA
jgi:uncharacterized protein with GYD domain